MNIYRKVNTVCLESARWYEILVYNKLNP